MKLLFVLVAIAGLANCGVVKPQSPIAPRDLLDDLNEFLELLPLGEMLDIMFVYLNDPEVQKGIVYMFSDEFAQLFLEMETIPEFDAILEFLEESNVNVRNFITEFKAILGIGRARTVREGGFPALINDIRDVIDWDEVQAFYDEKMQSSPEFNNLVTRLASEEFKELTDALYANEQMQNISNQFTEAGVDFAGLIRVVLKFLGLANKP